MTKTLTLCFAASLLLLAGPAAGEDWDLGEYQDLSTDDATQAETPAPPTAPVEEAKARTTRLAKVDLPVAHLPTASALPGSAPAQPASAEAEAVAEQSEYPRHVIRFGAGASWMRPLRLTGNSSDDQLLSDFSASWTPFGLPADIGVDLLIAREQRFFVRPNLKLFLFRHYWFSFFVEGTCEVMFLSETTELGGGGGLGMVIGLSDTLAIELKASATAIKLSQSSSDELFGRANAAEVDLLQDATGGGHLAVMPSASIHLMARF